jgi:serine phosphatase RsbU (regulator of sigma subunit)
MLDRKIQYFEPDAMATVLYGLYTPEAGDLAVSLAGHLPPVLAAPDGQAASVVVQPDPPIGAADDPQRRTTIVSIPPGGLPCCFTDGLVERRGQVLDHGISTLAVTMAKLVAASPAGSLAEDACIEAMRVLVGNAATRDDIAVLMLSRLT